MGLLDKIKPHEVTADLFRYKITISGRPKSGKSSLVYKLAKKEFNGDLSKLLLFGFERGYSALDGIHAIDIPDWETALELADELIDGKDDTTYKVLVFDTVDRLEKVATDYVIKQAKRNDKKNYKTLGDIPWGAGYAMLGDAVSDLISSLDMAGYTLWFITHDKDKKFETKDGLSYDKTVLSLGGRVGDIVKNDSDFIVFIELAKELDDEGNVVDNRYIHFRGDGALEAGGRFENLPDKIEYDVDDFLYTIKNAILQDGFDGDEEKMNEALKEQQAEFEEKLKENASKKEEKNETKKVDEDDSLDLEALQKELQVVVKGLSTEERKEVAPIIKEKLGTLKVREVTDAKLINEVISHIKDNY